MLALRSTCCGTAVPATVGRRTVMHSGRVVARLQPSRSVCVAGWKGLFPPTAPVPPPKPSLDINTIGLFVSFAALMITLAMSNKADMMSLKSDLSKEIVSVKTDLSQEIKMLSDKLDVVDKKYDEVKTENAGLERLVGRLEQDVNIALQGRVAASRDS